MSRSIAETFVEARRRWTEIADYPGKRPDDLAEAYDIQDAALSIWQRKVGGWKVGKIPSPKSEELGTNRLVGPIFEDAIQEEGSKAANFPIFDRGFAAVEAEFMLRLAPHNGPLPRTRDEAMTWIDDVRIGIEIASSPYAAINAEGPCVTVSDHGNNAGLLLGSPVPKELWSALDDIVVTLSVEGTKVGQASTATMLDGPFGAVCFLLRNLEQRGIACEAGWWISSGAITGVHEAKVGQSAVASFGKIGETVVRLISAEQARKVV